MQITLYSNFYKRQNSTLRPASGGTVKDVNLKRDCSISSPVFLLDGIDNSVNYVLWQAPGSFDRYYYVSDITLRNDNIYEVSCSLDVLATFKNDIGSTRAYIELAGDSSETMLPDLRLSQYLNKEILASTFNNSYLSNTYEYFLTCISTSGLGTPFATTYRMNAQNIVNLSNLLYDNLIQSIQNDFGNVDSCLISLKKLPINTSSIVSNAGQTVRIGKIAMTQGGITAVGDILADYVFSESHTATIPWRVSDFRNNNPYTSLHLYLPFVGVVELSPSDFIGTNEIKIETVYSLYTRQISYRISRVELPNPQIIATYSGQFGYDIPVSTYQPNTSGALNATIGGIGATIAGAAAAYATGGASAATLAAIGGGVTTIANTAMQLLHSTSSMNGNYNGAGMELLGYKPILMLEYHDTVMDPGDYKATIGLPYAKTDLISNHSGFLKCVAASVSCDGFSSDRESINTYVNSGFFYE